VIASHNARASVEECLSALVAQRPGDELEIVVVDNSTDGTTEFIRSRFPSIKILAEPPSALIPELWGVGIRQSRGEIVAITTAHFIPDKDWFSQILKAHEALVPAVGGAIENDGSGRIVDWAIYFCRYSPYMLPFRKAFVPEIAGDNASYKREYLNRCQHAWSDGFWESAVHTELKNAGFQLLLAPGIIVRHRRSFGVWSFIKQRFQHGRQFGRTRAAHFSVPKRTLYIFLSPVIPLMFLARITRQVVTKQRHQGKLLIAFPVLVVFLLAWSVGELIGYLRGP
jgi:glycosyltransferase involved in cell wall biosynthesis